MDSADSAEAAFTFYEQCLGGQLGPIFRYGGTPLADQVPADWQDQVMHGSLTIGELVLMGGDVAPDRYEEPHGFSLSLQIKSTSEAERIFHELGKDGMGRCRSRRRSGPRVSACWSISSESVADQLRRIRTASGRVRPRSARAWMLHRARPQFATG